MKIIGYILAVVCAISTFVLVILNPDDPNWFSNMRMWAIIATASGIVSLVAFKFRTIIKYVCAAIYVVATDIFGYKK